MLRYLRLLWLFTRFSLQEDTAYRLDFFMRLLMVLLHLGAEFIGLWTIFSNTRSLAGWNVWEVLVLLGVFRIMAGLIGLIIAPNMRWIMEDIRDGKLDFLLLKPIHAQFYASVRRVMLWRVSDFVIGVLMIAYGSYRLSHGVAVIDLIQFLVMLSSGAVIIYSFWLVLATSAFWFTRINNIEMVFWNIFEAGRYPVSIYPSWVRLALTYVVPLAFLTTFPAAVLVGKSHGSSVAVAILVAVVTLTGASAFWRFGLRHYSGASA